MVGENERGDKGEGGTDIELEKRRGDLTCRFSPESFSLISPSLGAGGGGGGGEVGGGRQPVGLMRTHVCDTRSKRGA